MVNEVVRAFQATRRADRLGTMVSFFEIPRSKRFEPEFS
jgi:hypothetical protein